MKSLRDGLRGVAAPLPGGYLPPLSPGWVVPGLALALGVVVYVGTGQLATGDTLGVAAIAGIVLAAAAVCLLMLAAGRSRPGLGRAWAIAYPVMAGAVLLAGAADSGKEASVSPVLLLNIGVVGLAARAFGARYVTALAIFSTAGVFAAEALGRSAGYPSDAWVAVSFAAVTVGAGAVFAAQARAAERGGEVQRLDPARMSASRLEAVARYSPAALALFGRDGRPVYASPAIESLLGAPITWPPEGADSGPADPAAAVADAVNGRPRRLEFTAIDPSGRTRILDGVFFPVDRGAALIAIDITDVRELTDRVSRVQRMETVGVLAGGLAHDFNNVLTAVLGNLHVVRLSLGNSADAEAVLDETTRACERAAEIIRRLMNYARPRATGVEAVAIRDVVEETAALVRGSLPPAVELDVRVPVGSHAVWANASELQQVLLNLVMNARDALPHGGTIHIWSGETTVVADGPRPAPSLVPGTYAVITVADTGTGMDATTLVRAFDPFFTTKEAGKGTGLGLATAQGIVQGYGGAIVAESTPGRGSTFRVYLPAVVTTAAVAAGAGR